MAKINIAKNEVPPVGQSHGVIADVILGTQKDGKGKEHASLEIRAQLGATDSEGKRFVVSKKYILFAKGVSQLRDDVASFRGKPPTTQEFKQFDPETEFLNKPCLVTISHVSEKGKGTVARISRIEPPSVENKLTLTDYVRETKPADQQG